MKNIIVSDIMTRNPVTISPNTNLLDCSKKMIKMKVGSLPLVEKKKLKGFISQHDILWAIIKKSAKSLNSIKAIEISPKKIATIRPNATIEEAFEKMKRTRFERLPVTHEGEFIGIITIKDILTFNPEFYPELEELSKIREETKKIERIKAKEKKITEGICEECGHHDWLYRFNGMVICESCMN